MQLIKYQAPTSVLDKLGDPKAGVPSGKILNPSDLIKVDRHGIDDSSCTNNKSAIIHCNNINPSLDLRSLNLWANRQSLLSPPESTMVDLSLLAAVLRLYLS